MECRSELASQKLSIARRAELLIGWCTLVLSTAVLLGSIGWAAILRSRADLTFVFHDSPANTVPEGHVQQVRMLKSRIPSGETLLYIMNRVNLSELWQFGLWERSLYPRNYVVVIDASQIHIQAYSALRNEKLIRYAISQGTSPVPTVFKWSEPLPGYPGSIPLVFGELNDDTKAQ